MFARIAAAQEGWRSVGGAQFKSLHIPLLTDDVCMQGDPTSPLPSSSLLLLLLLALLPVLLLATVAGRQQAASATTRTLC